jgi:hypothetical protein
MTMYKHEADECGVCKVASFERNNYFPGKTLSARDLLAEQRYFNEKRWLINRTVFGWGVVCGLDVSLEGDCLTVSPGLALDCCGHEVLVCERQTIHVQTVSDQLAADPANTGGRVRWLLCLEYCESKVEPVALPTGCDTDEPGREHNRFRDGYRLRFRVATEKCPDDQSVACCPHGSVARATPLQKLIVDRSRKCPTCGECDCIVLATGWLNPPSEQYGGLKLEPELWKYRRTVHTNLALADMFRCMHGCLPQISNINPLPYTSFSVESFLRALHDGLKVSFNRDMEAASVQYRRSCRLTIAVVHEEQGCPTQILVPVRQIEYPARTDSSGRTDYSGWTATYYFDASCAEYELRKTCHKHQRPAEVELVLHGSMILDTSGRALDAELIGNAFPTGNGVEGGELIVPYSVEP